MLVPHIQVFTPVENVHVPLWQRDNISLEELSQALVELRNHKNEQIDKWREEANNASFTYKGKRFACDKESRSNIEGTQGQINNRGAIPTIWTGGWKAMDKTFIEIGTVEEWYDFYEAMYNQGARNFAKSQYLKQVVSQKGSIQEIVELTWTNTLTPYDDPVEEQPE